MICYDRYVMIDMLCYGIVCHGMLCSTTLYTNLNLFITLKENHNKKKLSSKYVNSKMKNKILILEFSVRCWFFGPFQSSSSVGCLGLLRDLKEVEKEKEEEKETKW